jgi:hypothetical protein
MMDEKLITLTLFCTLYLSTILLMISNIVKLMSLALVGKYNYFLPDQALPLRVNSLGNRFFILVEVTRTYKCIYLMLDSLNFFFLRDRMICVMWHLVNYPHIAFSLGVKVRQGVMKFAGDGATSLLGIKPNSKVYSNTISMWDSSMVFFLTELSRTGIYWWDFLIPEPLQF